MAANFRAAYAKAIKFLLLCGVTLVLPGLPGCGALALDLEHGPARKEDSLHIDGASYHFSRLGQNERNYGLGFSYALGTLRSDYTWLDRTPLALSADIYRDSYNQTAHMVGVTARLSSWERGGFGFIAGVIHEQSSSRVSKLYYIPYVLPFVDVAIYRPVNLRMLAIPHVGNLTNGMLMFQLTVGLDN